jgi:restriction endonuclease S subunit
LEGLEVSEVRFSESAENKDFRMDSDFWTKQPKKNPLLKYLKIGDILKSSQYGISVSMNEENKGYPIYRMNEIHNMLCDLEVDKCADISKYEFQKFELKDRDVLFNRTNSFEWVGRTGVYYQNNKIPKTFASYLVRFNPDENVILPEYLATFLNTKQGVWDVKRRARQSINQTNVNPEEVKEIEIPLLPIAFQNEIRNRFEKANKDRILSQQIYRQAEELLLETLGLKDFTPSEKGINIKRFKESFLATGRMDAEYYQPKYEEMIKHIERFETERLNRIVSIKKSVEPGSDAYKTEGIPFIRVANVSKFGLTETDIFLDKSKFGNSGLQPKKDTILLSKDGTIGIAYKIEQDTDIITSGALLHLTVTNKDFLPDYVTLVLNSEVVKMQAERDAGGSIIQHWKPSEIEQVIIPKIPMPIQQQISALIQESFGLRTESEELLMEAKEMVEREVNNSHNQTLMLT